MRLLLGVLGLLALLALAHAASAPDIRAPEISTPSAHRGRAPPGFEEGGAAFHCRNALTFCMTFKQPSGTPTPER